MRPPSHHTLVIVIAALAVLPACRRVTAADPGAMAHLTADVALAPDSDVVSGVVPARTTMAALLRDQHIGANETAALVS